LVGHSLGGLVIQAYLAKAMSDKKNEAELRNIRQVLLIATPHHGANVFHLTRSALSRIFTNPQEKILKVLDPEIHDIVQDFRERLTDWPISVQCFWGMEDQIVPEASGRGGHLAGTALEGDHFTILKPTDLMDARYTSIAQAICHPIGHPEIFEIESFEMDVTVKPVSPKTPKAVSFGRHSRSKLVTSDNMAEVTHKVKFSRQNICAKPYKLRYRTRQNGSVVPYATSHPNLADAQELGLHDDYGYDHVFKFLPIAGDTYAVRWEVYRGFDPGNRDIHFHFNKPETRSHFHHFVLRLDLSEYLISGYQLNGAPTLYYRPIESDTCDQCTTMVSNDRIQPSSEDHKGKWEWRLDNIRKGVLTVRWDFEERK
jgi:hypothetical protein